MATAAAIAADLRGTVPSRHGARSRHGALSRRAFLGLLGVGALGALSGGAVAGTYRFGIESIEARLAGLRAPVRVAWLVDLHYGPFIRAGSVAAWVDAALSLAPDLILLGGDLVDHLAPDDVRPLLAELARLRAPLGVYGVWGNHEFARYPDAGDRQRFHDALEDAGVTMLINRGVDLRSDLHLVGLDADRVGPRVMQRALADRPDGSACLLATHKPDMLPRIPATVDLTLMGHTHGGQVVLPGIGPILMRTELGPEGTAGWVRAPALGYVSRGLGVVHLPVRINCPAELTLATLIPG